MTLWGMNIIELTAVALGIACVLLTIFQNIWCWPVGLAMVSFYIYIFFGAKLYSDAGLQVVYVGLQLYGWHQWLRGGPRNEQLAVSRLPAAGVLGWGMIGGIGTLALGYAMNRWTDASLAYWDAATTVYSLVAQWLLARKVLESWAFWILVDIMAIGVYATKGLYPTAILYAVFLALATWGLCAWLKSIRPATPAPAMASS